MLGRSVEVGVGHLVRAWHERLEVLLGVRDAGDRQCSLRGAVVGDVAADHLVLHGLAGELEVLLGHLPGRLDGLAATGREEDTVEIAGRVVRESLGELDRGGVRVGPQREVGELGHLLGRSVGDLLAAVAGLHGEQAREPVEVAIALIVEDVGAVAAHDDGDVPAVLVGRVTGEVHPEVIARHVGEAIGSGLAHVLR